MALTHTTSVILPAYNEANRILTTLSHIAEFHKTEPLHEVIVVDDGSTDHTVELVEGYTDRLPVKIIRHEVNRGKGAAVKTGMRAATGEWRLFMDADNSVPIDFLPRFLETAKTEGADIVIGSIELPGADINATEDEWYRRNAGRISKQLIRLVAVPGIYDTQRGFKLFSKKATDIVFPRQTVERWGFDIELLAIAKHHHLKIIELPVSWHNPGDSKIRSIDYLKTFGELALVVKNKWSGKYR